MENLYGRFLADLNAKDDLAFKFGDTLDVKASIGLVVITFLGTQTAYFLDKNIAGVSHFLQTASVFFLVAATVGMIVALWPREYLMIQPEENVASRISELIEHRAQYKEYTEADVLDELTSNEIQWATQRISINQSKNTEKSRWLVWAFTATAIFVGLNTLTLILVWITHPF
jgi:hypothetical protein